MPPLGRSNLKFKELMIHEMMKLRGFRWPIRKMRQILFLTHREPIFFYNNYNILRNIKVYAKFHDLHKQIQVFVNKFWYILLLIIQLLAYLLIFFLSAIEKSSSVGFCSSIAGSAAFHELASFLLSKGCYHSFRVQQPKSIHFFGFRVFRFSCRNSSVLIFQALGFSL